MNDSVHQMSLLVGEIRGEVKGLKDSIDSLNHMWGERERDAVAGRRLVHEKVDGMRADLSTLQADFHNVSNEVFSIKPQVETWKTERHERAGARRLGNRMWSAMIALAGLAGGGFAEVLHAWRGH